MWYYQDPNFYNISSQYAYVNEEKPIVIQTDFFWDEGNDFYAFRKYANLTCRWTSVTNPMKNKVTYAMMESIPIGSYRDDEYPTQVRCNTPPWKSKDKLNLQVSVNGQDYMSTYVIDIVDELKNLRLSPMAGPIMGGSNVTVWGTGFLASVPVTIPLYVKFGNLDYVQMTKEKVVESKYIQKDYQYDEIKMHPFRLKQAMNRLETITEGKSLNKYQYT